MTTKTIYMDMDEESEDEYVYSDKDDDKDNDKDESVFLDFYENLEIVKEITKDNQAIKNKSRSLSIDSESSDISKRPNFKCGSCKKSFLLDKSQKMIRCSYCGYRILFKLRTRNYITFKTE